MNRRTRWIATGAVAVAALGGATGIAVASGGDDDASDTPISGQPLDQASAAALEHTGGGTVIETETGDDGAAYGVEIRLASGRVVEVSLDDRFAVIGSATDDDGPTPRTVRPTETPRVRLWSDTCSCAGHQPPDEA